MSSRALGRQFHEMTREEFEAEPGTFFHGNPTGNFGHNQPQAHYGFHVGTKRAATEAVEARAGYGRYSAGTPIPAPKAEVRGGRLGVEMTNTPWTPHEDFPANGYMAGQIKRDRARRGYYYTNMGEDAGSISAVVPSRRQFKTHEDYSLKLGRRGRRSRHQRCRGTRRFLGRSVCSRRALLRRIRTYTLGSSY